MNKQYTRTELFAIWYKGQHTIAELAKTYGYDITSLSHSFTRELEILKKAKADRQKAVDNETKIQQNEADIAAKSGVVFITIEYGR